MIRTQIAQIIAQSLAQLVEDKRVRVSDIARAAGIHITTAICYVNGEALPKADKFSGLIALIDSQS
jgi:hypothetical protein